MKTWTDNTAIVTADLQRWEDGADTANTASSDIETLETGLATANDSITALQTSNTANTAAITALEAADVGLAADIAALNTSVDADLDTAKTQLKGLINQYRYTCTGTDDGAGIVTKLGGLLQGAGVGVKLDISGEAAFLGEIGIDTLSLSGKTAILDFSNAGKAEYEDDGSGVTLFPDITAGKVIIRGLRLNYTCSTAAAGTVTTVIVGSGYICEDCEISASVTQTGGAAELNFTGYKSPAYRCGCTVTASNKYAASVTGFSGSRFRDCSAKLTVNCTGTAKAGSAATHCATGFAGGDCMGCEADCTCCASNMGWGSAAGFKDLSRCINCTAASKSNTDAYGFYNVIDAVGCTGKASGKATGNMTGMTRLSLFGFYGPDISCTGCTGSGYSISPPQTSKEVVTSGFGGSGSYISLVNCRAPVAVITGYEQRYGIYTSATKSRILGCKIDSGFLVAAVQRPSGASHIWDENMMTRLAALEG